MTEPALLTFGLVLLAYLWGSIPTAVLVCHAFDIPDPRKKGSGNPGTTNVLRIGTRKAALVTLLGDAGKGYLALLPCVLLDLGSEIRALCAFAAIAGHMLPIFSSFKGGKGVATTFGACFGLFWPLAIVQLLVWCILAGISRRSSLASVGTALVSPIFIWLSAPQYIAIMLVISLLLITRHRSNISNLLSGTEPRI